MKSVYVRFQSEALGDNIAWLPYLEEYERINNVLVYSNCCYSNLFGDVYPDRYFSKNDGIGDVVEIGITNREIPLQRVASDCLGLTFAERKPRFNFSKLNKSVDKTITFSEFGSNYCKSWNNPYGWIKVIQHIVSKGYTPISVSKESTGLNNVRDCTGLDLLSVCNLIYSSHAFVGVSSGLAWLAWVLNVPVVMISGHTHSYFEFQSGNERISISDFNKNICVGCYNNNNVNVDWDDMWCPFHKGTIREHECTYSITPSMVVSKIDKILALKYK
jgi:autotransporter strand-loop-strand O-heptosyltransferase